MIDGNIDVVSLTGQITQNVSLEGGLLPIGPKGDKGDPGFSPVVTTSKSGKTTTVKFETATGNVYAYIQDGEDGQGSGDMLTDVYDQNKNGIVDNAEKVNGKTVESNVPANAVFTDSNAVWGNITGTLSDQTDLNTALNNKANVSDIPTVNDATLTIQKNGETIDSFTANSSTNKTVNVIVPTKTSDLTNDSNFVTSDGNATQSDEDTSLTFTNTLSAPMEIDLKGNTQQDSLSGKNKLNITDFTETKNGITLTVVGNQIKLNGTATGYTEFYLTTTPYTISSGTYTFSINKISGTIENNSGNTTLYNTLRNSNNSNLQQIRIKEGAEVNTNTYSSEETISKFMISSSNGIKYTNYTYNLQLEQGSTATSYEQYCGGIPSPNPDYPQDVNVVEGNNTITISDDNEHSTSYNINLGSIKLCKIGTYQDYFYKDSGKWYLHKEVGKVVLDGSETYEMLNSSYANTHRFLYNFNDVYNSGNREDTYVYVISNKLVATDFMTIYQGRGGTPNMISNYNETGYSRFVMRIPNDYATSVADFKTWLSTNNIEVRYVLATPTNTEITDTTLIEQLEAIANATSYEGETNINQVNNDLPFIITVEVFNDNYNGRYYSLKAMYDKIYSGGNS